MTTTLVWTQAILIGYPFAIQMEFLFGATPFDIAIFDAEFAIRLTTSTAPSLQLTALSLGLGQIAFSLTGSQTALLTAGQYIGQVQLTNKVTGFVSHFFNVSMSVKPSLIAP